MAYPASDNAFRQSDALELGARVATQLKNHAQRVRDRAAAGPLPATVLLSMDEDFRAYKAELQRVAAVPGIVEYAREQYEEPLLDLGVETTTLVAAIDTVLTWVRSTFPAEGAGYLLARQWNPDTAVGGTVDRSFTTTQTALLRTHLDALIAAVR